MKPEPTKEQVDGSELVGRRAVEDALALKYLALAEMYCAFNSVCSRRVLEAKTIYVQRFEPATYGHSQPLRRVIGSSIECIQKGTEVPHELEDEILFRKLHEATSLRVEAVYNTIVELIHGKGVGGKRVQYVEALDLFDYSAHYFSMHTGSVYASIKNPKSTWKRGESDA